LSEVLAVLKELKEEGVQKKKLIEVPKNKQDNMSLLMLQSLSRLKSESNSYLKSKVIY
jgi:hypothetical protein